MASPSTITASDRTALDREMANWLGTSADAVHSPGIKYVEWPGPERNGWLGYNKSFFAFASLADPSSMTIASSREGIDAIRDLHLESRGPQAIERILTTVSAVFETDGCYPFDILCGSVQGMNLTLDPSRVRAQEPADADAVRWDGRNLADEVNGTVFSTHDENGMTAWAGIKRRNGPAWEFQVGTRDDMRQRGLARLVSSHAIRQLQHDGITPYYAHERGNVASAALAKALGFEPYGIGIMAEHRYWVPMDDR